MSLNHTIRLYDYPYEDLIDRFAEDHYEPTIILTKLSKIYLADKEINIDNIQVFGENMKKIMGHQTSLYCITSSNILGDTIIGLRNAGLHIRNILTIPVTNNYLEGCCVKNRTYYDENKLMYVVFASIGCHGRKLNYTKLVKEKGSCIYPACWSWFKGDEIKACETIIKISSDHRDEVFDPFMGIGDVGSAAIRADRHFTGTEPDGAKFRQAWDRLDKQGE